MSVALLAMPLAQGKCWNCVVISSMADIAATVTDTISTTEICGLSYLEVCIGKDSTVVSSDACCEPVIEIIAEEGALLPP